MLSSLANSWKKDKRKGIKVSFSDMADENSLSPKRRYSSAKEVHDSRYRCHSSGRMFCLTFEFGNGAKWGRVMFISMLWWRQSRRKGHEQSQVCRSFLQKRYCELLHPFVRHGVMMGHACSRREPHPIRPGAVLARQDLPTSER
jgi:hypothetical protein